MESGSSKVPEVPGCKVQVRSARKVPEASGWSRVGHVKGSREVPEVPGWSGEGKV